MSDTNSRLSEIRGSNAIWRPQRFFAHRLQSAREFEHLNDGGGLAVDFYPVSRGAPQVRVEGGQSRTMSLWHTQSATGFLTVPTLEADLFTIRFVTSGQMIRRNWRGEHAAMQGYATFSALEDMRNGEASAGFSAISSTIARTSLLASYHALERKLDRPLPVLEPLTSIDTLGMRALLLSLEQMQIRLRDVRTSEDLFFPLLEEIVSYQLLSVWPRAPAAELPSAGNLAAAHVRSAIDYIEAHLATPLRLADVAAAAGVSVRMLQMSFKRELSMTPVEFIIERRLQHVHRDLCRESHRDTSIAELGRRWGFAHMSDFAQRYRRRFGCAPSDTRRDMLRKVE
ncbi:helix-turn-helix transcriptional regulator [Methylorubrum rhodesianum]|jgi:AraC-like DNA-binding protein|nr:MULTISPECIES: helix-turn-helix transcriptional regulator [Methylorubrum]MBB5764855.1 AraC-like DNA-binding protein [Methylorubrum rhodesianum]MBI1691328.1 AraC family transcriptional regulator [Methylorubrum sp. DB1722]